MTSFIEVEALFATVGRGRTDDRDIESRFLRRASTGCNRPAVIGGAQGVLGRDVGPDQLGNLPRRAAARQFEGAKPMCFS